MAQWCSKNVLKYLHAIIGLSDTTKGSITLISPFRIFWERYKKPKRNNEDIEIRMQIGSTLDCIPRVNCAVESTGHRNEPRQRYDRAKGILFEFRFSY